MSYKQPPPSIKIREGTFAPSHLAQRCPVCNGFGTIKYGTKTCVACEGKCYVLVPARREEDRE